MRGVVCGAVSAPRLVCRLKACPDDGRSVIVNLEVVCPNPRGFGEGFVVALEVSRLRPDYYDQIVYSACLVVRDM